MKKKEKDMNKATKQEEMSVHRTLNITLSIPNYKSF
jgi:hypothetical protein